MAKSITERYDDLLADCARLRDECGALHSRLDRLGDKLKHQDRMRELLLKLADPDLPESMAMDTLKWAQKMIREWEGR